MIVNLIDADSLIYKVCYAAKDNDNFKDYRDALDNWVKQILSDTNSTHYLGFLTMTSTFRHKIATNREYKSGRPSRKPRFFHDLRDYSIDHWKLNWHENIEAEDLVAVHCKEFRTKGIPYYISGIDHDLHQLVGDHYNYVTKEVRSISKDEANWNFWASMITGCSTDKIQGIPKMGEVKALNLLSENGLKYNSEICRNKVLETYLKHYGNSKGIKLFSETFRLLYLLRTIHEVWEEGGLACSIYEPIPLVSNKSDEVAEL